MGDSAEELMDRMFRFKVGDLVVLKSDHFGMQAVIEKGYEPTLKAPSVVVERIAQQCHGGVQKFCWLSDGMGKAYGPVSEMLLVPWSEYLNAVPVDRRTTESEGHLVESFAKVIGDSQNILVQEVVSEFRSLSERIARLER